MTIPVKLKRSGTTTATPSSLEYGELAINYADGVVFYRDSSDVIQSFTLQAYALSSHTHAASDITSGTLDAARLPLATTGAVGGVIVGTGLGVSSGTVSVTYGTTSGTACQGNDSRLSDARTPTSHTHGNITNAGAIGSTANLPIITTTSGVLTTGSFGTTAATFCQGNDSRLSDTRTPTDGSVTTAKIADDAVTYAKIQNVSTTDRLLGRSSAGAGDVEEVTCTAFGRSLIDDADAAAARTTLGVQPTASPAFTGNATITASSGIPLTLNGNSTALRIEESSGETIDIYRSASDGLLYLDANQQTFSGFVFRTTPTGGSITSALMIGSSQRVTLYNQLLVTAGSGSSGSYKPGIAVSGDDDTGIQQIGGANTLSLVTGGSERVRVDANGNVLAGTGSGRVVSGYTFLTINNTSGSYVDLLSNGTRVGELGAEPGSLTLAAVGVSIPLILRTNDAARVTIGVDGSVTAADVYDDTVGATNRDLFIDDTGRLGYVSSIRASKTNIAAIDDVTWLRDLTPVSFHYRRKDDEGNYTDDPDGTLDYGLIAEDVEPVAPELCFYDVVDGEPQLRGVHYSKLITPMLRYIQQLEQRIAALEEKLNHA